MAFSTHNSGISSQQIKAEIQSAVKQFQALKEAIGTVIVGQSHLIDRLLIGILTNGHVLLEGSLAWQNL